MTHDLCNFIPPRANFLATMLAGEREWMRQHGQYLDRLLEQGLVVAHGPVMDSTHPAGGYGVSLFCILDDQDIAALTSADPIVRNGVGHYEHHPMLHINSRG